MKPWFVLAGLAALAGFGGVAAVTLGQQKDGSYLVSSGQRLELLGSINKLEYARPKDLAISPDKERLAVLSTRRLYVADLTGKEIAGADVTAAPLGVAWSPDGSKLYASLGSGKIGRFTWDGTSLKPDGLIAVEEEGAKGNPMPVGLAVGRDGSLFAALSIRNRIVKLSPEGAILQTWNAEACPYHLAISPDGQYLAASNRGGAIIKPPAEQMDPNTGRPFEASGSPSASSAGTEVRIDPQTDAALGGSVTIVPLGSGEPFTVNVGRQPAGSEFSADGRWLYVANSDEDTLSLVDVLGKKEAGRVALAPKEDSVFGQVPTDVVLAPEEDRVYVSLGGANAIAVLKGLSNPKVEGYVPTAWYPAAIEASKGEIIAACSKGIGSRPANKTTSFYVHDSVGVVQTLPLELFRDPRAMSRRVARNNDWSKTQTPRKNRAPMVVPQRIGEPSLFKHVVYIIKENLTYDTIMGDIKEGNGDPSLCVFNENVSPNHHALAKRFGLFDNFYISGTNSADGHQWVASSIGNDYIERNYSAATRSYPYDGGDPLAFSPSGFLWTQAKKAGRSVRIFGEFVDKPSVTDSKTGKGVSWQRCWEDYKSGKNEIVIKAGTSQKVVQDLMHPTYIGFPSNVSDQWRADTFLAELGEWEKKGSMPDFSMMLLPNDHTVGTRQGWPTPRAAVADNDYALGRIVEAITRSRFWSETLVIVAQDDSQNGTDHVDGHRSVMFVISPYSRKGTTVSDFYNHATIAATIGRVLGFAPMTRFDAKAKPMVNAFGDSVDLTPYQAVKNNIPFDELNPPAKALTGENRLLAEACGRMDWSEMDTQDQGVLNRAIWKAEAPRSVALRGFSASAPHGKAAEADEDD